MWCSHANSCAHTDSPAARTKHTSMRYDTTPNIIKIIIMMMVNAECLSANALLFRVHAVFVSFRMNDERMNYNWFIMYMAEGRVYDDDNLVRCVYAIAGVLVDANSHFFLYFLFRFVLSANYFHIRENRPKISKQRKKNKIECFDLLSSFIESHRLFSDIPINRKRNWRTVASHWMIQL